MKTIKKLGVMSLAKTLSIITGGVYLVMAVAANLIGLKSPEIIQQAGIQIGVLPLISYVIAGIISGFIMGAIIAYLYNLISPKIGGIQIEID